MSISVMGLPFVGHVGLPLTSIVLVRTSGKSLPTLPLCVSVPLTAVGCKDPDALSCSCGVPDLAGFESADDLSCEAVCFVARVVVLHVASEWKHDKKH